ncbi:conserved protein of unknown function (plasmid) [Rhodovastum atsumiense]|uniref:Uncharacterized protein n=1 Tax=Rhodovastum atsumiense TaxID=504468 RepID=A0A5M6INR8_9PROT|nr:hypothetical protein [Rhodovastum atsumiense]KAA5609627.1 hypothetical protein F1189_22965 [Rhodovastum atsumiense]CAH2606489.1 conserved protein of unknown function [Rhodovastum atsumiense]
MADQQTTAPVVAKKSFKDGHVAVGVQLRCRGFGNDSAKIDASTDLTTDQARALARSLVELAEQAEAKVAAKAAADERRRKCRDREVAAGRMVVIGGR